MLVLPNLSKDMKESPKEKLFEQFKSALICKNISTINCGDGNYNCKKCKHNSERKTMDKIQEKKFQILTDVCTLKDGLSWNELTEDLNELIEISQKDLLQALEVCYASLCTYGAHPIIQQQVEKVLLKSIKQTNCL